VYTQLGAASSIDGIRTLMENRYETGITSVLLMLSMSQIECNKAFM